MDLSRWTNQATALNLHTLMEIAINLSTRRVSTGWNSPYCEIMDKFTVISISVKLRNLKQYLDWLIGLSLHLMHTVTEFCVRQPLLLFPYCLLELLSIWIFRYSDIRNRFWELKTVLFDNLDIRIIRIRGSEFDSGFRSMFRKKETLMYLMNFTLHKLLT